MLAQEKDSIEYGDGVAWFRGSMIGKGGFGCVYLATLKKPKSKYSYYPPLMAVKSAEISSSGSIQKEKEVLSNVQGCPNIIKCFGEEITMSKNGAMVYNLLLEYCSGGTLADRIKKSAGKGLPEFEVKVYARSILRGLKHIHGNGFVHCDLKPDNILLSGKSRRIGICEFSAKIGDFGLSKRGKNYSKKRKLELYWRGTPMYLSPEAILENLQEAPSDIWAVGCIVLEMLMGQPPWKNESNEEILESIGVGKELPKVPGGLSKEARDFLKGCFVRKSVYRLTAEMLLNHSFFEGLGEEENEEFEEVEDLNESDGEFSCGVFSDDDFDGEFESDFAEEDEDEFAVDEVNGVTSSSIDSGLDGTISRGVSSKRRRECTVSFPLSAGV